MAGFFDFLTDPSFLNVVNTGMQVAGRINSAGDRTNYGAEVAAAAHLQGDQLRQQGLSSQAAGQAQAAIEARRARIVESNALAAAAASGGGASDPTVVNVISRIAQEGAYRQAVALYEGDDRARLLRMQAAAREAEGASRQQSADSQANNDYLSAFGTAARGLAAERDIIDKKSGSGGSFMSSQQDASLYQRFGNGGPRMGEY